MIYQIKKRIRELSHTNRTFELLYSLANLCKVKLLMGLSDETYAKIKYKENTGKTLNLTDPRTFNEKLWWLKVHNRDPLLTTCTDKLLVRKYVEGLGLVDCTGFAGHVEKTYNEAKGRVRNYEREQISQKV